MGQVFRARDRKLQRDVAIKILLPQVANDAGRLARFTREAQVLASLNHPNIAQIYGVEEAGGVIALVMELVEGEELSARIRRGALPLDEALAMARQIADALATAHDHGIVHRDLKPSNIRVRDDGMVKVLDFGLAKSLDAVASPTATAMNAPTRSMPETAAGAILGTAAYMSPEQARGKPVDRRADIWSLGCVLFEMLAGKRPFDEAEPTDLIVAVVGKEPEWSKLPPSTPPPILALLRRCLEKDARRRLDSAAVFGFEIGGWASPLESEPARPGRAAAWATAGAVIGALVAVLATTGMPRAVTEETTASLISMAPAEYLQSSELDERTGGRSGRTSLALSPDGRSLVFAAVRNGRRHLYRRALDSLDATPLPGTDEAMNPFFSPDGAWVGFYSAGAIRKVPLTGDAPPTELCRTSSIYGAAWGSRMIVFANEFGGLLSVPDGGGAITKLTNIDGARNEYSHRLPEFLPDGRRVIFTITNIYQPLWDDARLAVVDPATGARHDLVAGASPRYMAPGYLLFMRSGKLMAAAFDPARAALLGDPTTMIEGVAQAANMPSSSGDSGSGQFAVSATGTLVYAPGSVFPDRDIEVLAVDRRGGKRSLPLPPAPYLSPRLSPDGSKLALWTQGIDRNIWIVELSRNTRTRITLEGRNHRAIWSPDGSLTYSGMVSGTYNLFSIRPDGDRVPRRLLTSANQQMASSWSPDGRTLLFLESPSPNDPQVVNAFDAQQQRVWAFIGTGKANITAPAISADGAWVAYVSDESGRDEVYVERFPDLGGRSQVSSNGGGAPMWSPRGRRLYFTSGLPGSIEMWMVETGSGPSLAIGQPQKLFAGDFAAQQSTRGYDLSADEQTFYITRDKVRSAVHSDQVVIVQHWTEELRRRAPAK